MGWVCAQWQKPAELQWPNFKTWWLKTIQISPVTFLSIRNQKLKVLVILHFFWKFLGKSCSWHHIAPRSICIGWLKILSSTFQSTSFYPILLSRRLHVYMCARDCACRCMCCMHLSMLMGACAYMCAGTHAMHVEVILHHVYSPIISSLYFLTQSILCNLELIYSASLVSEWSSWKAPIFTSPALGWQGGIGNTLATEPSP